MNVSNSARECQITCLDIWNMSYVSKYTCKGYVIVKGLPSSIIIVQTIAYRTILLEEETFYLNVVYFVSQNQNKIRNQNKWKWTNTFWNKMKEYLCMYVSENILLLCLAILLSTTFPVLVFQQNSGKGEKHLFTFFWRHSSSY